MGEDLPIKLSVDSIERLEDYLNSHGISPDDLFKILNKYDEELEREKIHELENKIELAVSAISEKELKNMLNKAAKNNKELKIIKPPKRFTPEENEKTPVKIMFRDEAWNEVKVSFKPAEYFDKGVTTIILASFKYGMEISRDLEDCLMKTDPKSPLLKKMDNKTKINLLTKLYNLIEETRNS